MGRRLFNGLKFSENRWPYVDQDGCTWIIVPGTDPPVHLQIQNGPPLIILPALVADLNAYVEPTRDEDSASWTPGNSVATSNHPGGTAVDVNWGLHKDGTGPAFINRGFTAAQVEEIRRILAFYEGMIWWGNDWPNYHDPMHWQMGSNSSGDFDTYHSDNKTGWDGGVDPKVYDFINRKIRSDGFSTYRRGGTVPPPPPPPPASNKAADVLARATGIPLAKATAILSQVSFALVKANCTNPRRIAAALAQWVVESGHFVYTEEIATGPESEERWKYKGRTWIQLTWLENYRGFSEWCHSLGLVPTSDYFVVRPHELADQKWAALGPAYWWSVKYPRINEYADRGDIDNVSKWVNAPAWVDKPDKHANGEKERRDAYNRALALGDQLLTLITTDAGEDDLSAEAERMIREMYDEYKKEKRGPSRSFLATDGALVESPLGFLYNIDGNVWTQQLTWAYLFYVPLAVEVVESVAKNGSYQGSWAASNDFNVWLNQFGQAYCRGLVEFKAALVSKLSLSGQPTVTTASGQTVSAAAIAAEVASLLPRPDTAALNAVNSENARLLAENARLQAQVAVPAVVRDESGTVATVERTSGEIAGSVLDSVKEWTARLLAMNAEERGALSTSLRALQPPTGGDQS